MRLSTQSTASRPSLLLLPLALIAITLPSTTAQRDAKRGITILSDLVVADWSLLIESGISWYWNWSPDPGNSTLVKDLTFIPEIHDLNNIAADLTQVKSLPSSSTQLLTFNEPDGSISSGGTAISPDDAAAAYIKDILPLRKSNGGQFLISHPATTGSPQGLTWLTSFNESCYKLEPKTGCPLDFVATHWYGDFAGLTSWVGQLEDFYNVNSTGIKIWVTEVAIPKASADDTLAMLNQSLPYLDGADEVGGYAWFGNFRTSDSNEFTGTEVALFDKSGGLTAVGAEYLNANGNTTFKTGMKGVGASGAGNVRANILTLVGLFVVGLWMISI